MRLAVGLDPATPATIVASRALVTSTRFAWPTAAPSAAVFSSSSAFGPLMPTDANERLDVVQRCGQAVGVVADLPGQRQHPVAQHPELLLLTPACVCNVSITDWNPAALTTRTTRPAATPSSANFALPQAPSISPRRLRPSPRPRAACLAPASARVPGLLRGERGLLGRQQAHLGVQRRQRRRAVLVHRRGQRIRRRRLVALDRGQPRRRVRRLRLRRVSSSSAADTSSAVAAASFSWSRKTDSFALRLGGVDPRDELRVVLAQLVGLGRDRVELRLRVAVARRGSSSMTSLVSATDRSPVSAAL